MCHVPRLNMDWEPGGQGPYGPYGPGNIRARDHMRQGTQGPCPPPPTHHPSSPPSLGETSGNQTMSGLAPGPTAPPHPPPWFRPKPKPSRPSPGPLAKLNSNWMMLLSVVFIMNNSAKTNQALITTKLTRNLQRFFHLTTVLGREIGFMVSSQFCNESYEQK